MKNKDDILKAAIKKCPGATREQTTSEDLMDLLYLLGAIFKEARSGLNPLHEYYYPNISHKLNKGLKIRYSLPDSETIYYVIYRSFSMLSNDLGFFLLTTNRVIVEFPNEGIFHHWKYEDIALFNFHSLILVNNDCMHDLPLTDIIGNDKKANPEFQQWLMTCIVGKINNLHTGEQKLIDKSREAICQEFESIKGADATQKIAWLEKWESKLTTIPNRYYGEHLTTLAYLSIGFALNIVPDNYTDDSWIADRCRFWAKVIDYAKIYQDKNLDNNDEMNAFKAIASMRLYHNYYGYGFMHYLFQPYRDDFSLIEKNELDVWRNDALCIIVHDFLSYDYNDRRFLVIDSKISYSESKNFIVLPKTGLPEELKFPLGHPQEGELYMCHPYNHNLYIPYESCEFELFKDKMDELRLVLQAMGATSIKIYEANDWETHNNSSRNIAVDGSVNAKINRANGELQQENKSDEFEKLRHEYETESIFEPQRMPYIPDNLVWYPHQADWQRLFEQRKGGLKRHRISISIAKETKISEQKRLGLKADFQALILKINAGANIDTESMFETKSSSVWTLDVEFASLEELRARENAANSLDSGPIQPVHHATIAENIPVAEPTDDELKYMEEIKFCLEDDGTIDDKERRHLERMQAKFDISAERASRLETMAAATAKAILSPEEQEYCDAVAEYALDGELSERDLRLLTRLASSLNIPTEREKELQTNIIHKNE